MYLNPPTAYPAIDKGITETITPATGMRLKKKIISENNANSGMHNAKQVVYHGITNAEELCFFTQRSLQNVTDIVNLGKK